MRNTHTQIDYLSIIILALTCGLLSAFACWLASLIDPAFHGWIGTSFAIATLFVGAALWAEAV